MAVSSALHFDIKFSQLEYMVHQLTNPGIPPAEKQDICTSIQFARPCDLVMFLQHFRRDFPTPDLMMGPSAAAVLRMRERQKVFHTMRS